MSLALRRQGISNPQRALVLPEASARESALVDGWPIHGAAHLLDVVRELPALSQADAPPWPPARPEATRTPSRHGDFAEVKGQAGAKRALEIAAAGGLGVVMVGPPGTGKSMLAQRFVSLLPALDDDEALESAAVLSLTGTFSMARWVSAPTEN